jgi:pimeloyl-ACP methyl ester carboxylesterase
MHGSDDELTPALNARLLQQRIPNAHLHVHDGGRHGFFDEFADDTDPVLDTFWSSVV